MAFVGRPPRRNRVPKSMDEFTFLQENLVALNNRTDGMQKQLDDLGFEVHKVRSHQAQHDKRFAHVDRRFDRVDQRLDQMKQDVDQRFQQVDQRLDEMKDDVGQRFDGVNGRLDGIDGKLD